MYLLFRCVEAITKHEIPAFIDLIFYLSGGFVYRNWISPVVNMIYMFLYLPE